MNCLTPFLNRVGRAAWRLTPFGLGLPCLLGVKCIDAIPAIVGRQDAAAVADATMDAIRDGTSVEPNTLCPNPNQARISVQSFAYNNQCGCAEATGKTCTVAAGTTVVWIFSDSEDHNVTSLADAFPASGAFLAGTYQHTFATPGTFGYGCSLHPNDMRGYSIIAK